MDLTCILEYMFSWYVFLPPHKNPVLHWFRAPQVRRQPRARQASGREARPRDGRGHGLDVVPDLRRVCPGILLRHRPHSRVEGGPR